MSISQAWNNQNEGFPLALVTGAGHRLGKVFALTLARLGYGIILHYHHAEKEAIETEVEIRRLGVPVFRIQADLGLESGINGLFDRIESSIISTAAGSMTFRVLVNSAAIMPRVKAEDISPAEFDDVIALNLKAPFFCAQKAYKLMPEKGLIVNILDVATQKTWSGYPAYTISKTGLEAATRILARSFAPRVRVNAIAPGLALPAEEIQPEKWEELVRRLPISRAASKDELGSALEFLVKNEYITGQTITVDGGYSLL